MRNKKQSKENNLQNCLNRFWRTKENKWKNRELDAAYNNEFAKVAKDFPKLAGKSEVLKKLAFQPDNVNKTLEQIAIETFGDLIGRATTETSKQSGGEKVEVTFSENMTADELAIVDSDPALKKKFMDWSAKKFN